MKKLLPLFMVTLLTGCSAAMQPAKQVNIPYQFDANLAKKQLESGSEVLQGNAFLRQVGGGIVNCAGSNVDLYPSSPYSNARIEAKYPVDMWLGTRIKSKDTFNPEAPEFESIKRSTTCDSDGNFVFESVKPGNYIVVTEVRWSVAGPYGPQPQGGYIFKTVAVNKGQKSKLVISQ